MSGNIFGPANTPMIDVAPRSGTPFTRAQVKDFQFEIGAWHDDFRFGYGDNNVYYGWPHSGIAIFQVNVFTDESEVRIALGDTVTRFHIAYDTPNVLRRFPTSIRLPPGVLWIGMLLVDDFFEPLRSSVNNRYVDAPVSAPSPNLGAFPPASWPVDL